MTAIAILALHFLAPDCAAAPRKTSDGAYEVAVPAGWRFVDLTSEKGDAAGPKNIFYLSHKNKGVSLSVSIARPGSCRQRPTVSAALADGSTFRYGEDSFIESGRAVHNGRMHAYASPAHEICGIVGKSDGLFVARVSSKRAPDKKDWNAVLRALASLRTLRAR